MSLQVNMADFRSKSSISSPPVRSATEQPRRAQYLRRRALPLVTTVRPKATSGHGNRCCGIEVGASETLAPPSHGYLAQRAQFLSGQRSATVKRRAFSCSMKALIILYVIFSSPGAMSQMGSRNLRSFENPSGTIDFL